MRTQRSDRVVLITGGSGFIGSHLAEAVVARGDRVVIIDDLSTGRRENLATLERSRVTLLEGTVTDRLPSVDGRVDEIYHLAAAVGVRLVVDEPIHTIETNVHETSRILAFAAEREAPVLIASTSEVYGKSTKTPFAEDDDVVYGPTTLSRWSYACSKAIDEYLALAWNRTRGLPVVIARFFNTVGPRQVGRYGMVLPRFVAAALAGIPLEVYGDGLQTRCFCDVRDVVNVVQRLAGDPALHGRVYNVGHDEPISIRDLARLVVDTLASQSELTFVPYEKAYSPGFDDLRDRVPDLTRIRQSTGWRPRIPLVETIRDVARSIDAAVAVRGGAR